MRLKNICVPIQWGCLRYIKREWEKLLKDEFDSLADFLLPTNDLANRHPGTEASYWQELKVQVKPDGRVIGAPDRSRIRIELTTADILIHKFDFCRFRKEMCNGFGLMPQTGEIDQREQTVPWGFWEPEKGARFPITLIQGWYGRTLRDRLMETALNREAAGEIILTGNRNEWKEDVPDIARKHKLLLVPLDDIIQIEDSKFLPTPEWNEYLTAFCKMVEMDLPSSLRDKQPGNLFAKRGEWLCRFSGKDVTLNGKLQGPAFIRRLMMTPHQEVHVEQLWKEVFGTGKENFAQIESGAEGEWDSFLSSGDDVLDAEGKADYQKRLLQLNRERAEAESANDDAWLERIDGETEAISTQLDKSVDGKGRARKVGDEQDRLRKRISRNITFFLNKIQKEHRELSDHLEQSVVLGEHMSYRPNKKVEWSFE